MTQTLAGVAVLSGAVDSATPVQVLLVARVGSLAGFQLLELKTISTVLEEDS